MKVCLPLLVAFFAFSGLGFANDLANPGEQITLFTFANRVSVSPETSNASAIANGIADSARVEAIDEADKRLAGERNLNEKVDKVQQTLSFIKPDAVAANHIGEIITRFEKTGLRIAAIKMVRLSKEKAKDFYAVHKNRPFFNDLTDYMSSGPILAMILEGDNAIAKSREIIGATDPRKAAPGTIRADFATAIEKNAVHGSDAPETAKEEIIFFFPPDEIFAR